MGRRQGAEKANKKAKNRDGSRVAKNRDQLNKDVAATQVALPQRAPRASPPGQGLEASDSFAKLRLLSHQVHAHTARTPPLPSFQTQWASRRRGGGRRRRPYPAGLKSGLSAFGPDQLVTGFASGNELGEKGKEKREKKKTSLWAKVDTVRRVLGGE